MQTVYQARRASQRLLLDKRHRLGRGYATRALALLLGYVRSIGIADAEAHIAADNRYPAGSRKRQTSFQQAPTPTPQKTALP
jgi:hypothetical protein